MNRSILITLTIALIGFQGFAQKAPKRDIAVVVNFPDVPIPIPNYRSFWNSMAHLIDWDNNGYVKVGHTGVILIEASTGENQYFDMGRYDDRDDLMGPRPDFYGVVRSPRHVPVLRSQVKARIEQGWLTNLDEILAELVKTGLFSAYGRMESVVVYHLNYSTMLERARSLEQQGYHYYGAPAHLYCTNFVRKVIRAGGYPFPWLVFTGSQTTRHILKRYRQ